MSDDVPFNPFYIGPHPSKACAVAEAPGQQCSPNCPPPEGQASGTATASASGTASTSAVKPGAAGASGAPGTAAPAEGQENQTVPSGNAGGMLIVSMVNIYSPSEVLAAAAGLVESGPPGTATGTGAAGTGAVGTGAAGTGATGAAGTAGTGTGTGADQAAPAPKNIICKPYPCMEGARSEGPECD
ncbi:collagen alpha-2(I) chain [Drosophila ficusphila]|uniref:collagen alpha-2(I) chain n=1 Tax=Drosophila ficusphila TaxID=30025 RepID=UPI0007E6A83D|nr:collagen alpha-2(I) chain [Drosophila ficusphila]